MDGWGALLAPKSNKRARVGQFTCVTHSRLPAGSASRQEESTPSKADAKAGALSTSGQKVSISPGKPTPCAPASWPISQPDNNLDHVHPGDENAPCGLRNSGGLSMQTIGQDLRVAIRQLLKNPGFCWFCVLIMTLRIGAHTAVCSVVNRGRRRAASVSQARPDRHALRSMEPKATVAAWYRLPDFHDWHDQNTAFTALAYSPASNGQGTRTLFPLARRPTLGEDVFIPRRCLLKQNSSRRKSSQPRPPNSGCSSVYAAP